MPLAMFGQIYAGHNSLAGSLFTGLIAWAIFMRDQDR